MQIALIPYFLAVNFAVDCIDGDNPHKVEWTHRVNLSLTIQNTALGNVIENFMETAIIKCRLHDESTIACTWTWENEKIREDSPGSFMFKFDERGVMSAIVKKDTKPAKLLHLKKLAALMSVDANLTGKQELTTGECDTKFTVLHYEVMKNSHEETQYGPFILQPLQFPGWPTASGANVDIIKTTNPETCPLLKDYLDFMITGHANVKSYESSMRIQDPFTFESKRHVKGNMIINEDEVKLTENQKLELINVEVVQDDLPSLLDEETTTIHYRTSDDTKLLHEHISA